MKIKLDENLPASLIAILTAQGLDADTIPDEGLSGKDDQTVWQTAQADGRFFITQDLDFSDARIYGAGTHHGLMLVRLAQPSAPALRTAITAVAGQFTDWAGCFVVLTDTKLRVQRPAP